MTMRITPTEDLCPECGNSWLHLHERIVESYGHDDANVKALLVCTNSACGYRVVA